MNLPDIFRDNAEDCALLAERAGDEAVKRALKRMEEAWRTLAMQNGNGPERIIRSPPCSRSDAKSCALLAKPGNDRERGDATGLWIFRRDILDRHGKAGGIGFHVNTVHVARDRWISPDFQSRSIGTNACERQRDGNIQICGKPFRGLARRTLEYPERFGNCFDVDVVFDDIRSAGEPQDRLSRHHPDRMDVPDRCRLTASRPISAPVGTTI